MKQPKRLTLKQAINATRKPLTRPGDLRMVQYAKELIGLPSFPNGEMHSPYMPDNRDLSVMSFRQPETESALRELYVNGGWLESAEHLSDKELALLGNGWAGIVRPSGLVGSWGDPSELERDIVEAIDSIPAEYSIAVHYIVREIVLRLHKKYAPDAERGRAQSEGQAKKASKERYARSDDDRTLVDVIRTLSREHRNAKPSEVWPHLKPALEEWTREPVTEIESEVLDSRSYRYTPPNAEGDSVRPISYRTFRGLLSDVRGGKNGN